MIGVEVDTDFPRRRCHEEGGLCGGRIRPEKPVVLEPRRQILPFPHPASADQKLGRACLSSRFLLYPPVDLTLDGHRVFTPIAIDQDPRRAIFVNQLDGARRQVGAEVCFGHLRDAETLAGIQTPTHLRLGRILGGQSEHFRLG